jgi:hypothetical protein
MPNDLSRACVEQHFSCLSCMRPNSICSWYTPAPGSATASGTAQ